MDDIRTTLARSPAVALAKRALAAGVASAAMIQKSWAERGADHQGSEVGNRRGERDHHPAPPPKRLGGDLSLCRASGFGPGVRKVAGAAPGAPIAADGSGARPGKVQRLTGVREAVARGRVEERKGVEEGRRTLRLGER